jgi:prepilin-type N-terminal cleavage/methylation domain-containing protein
MRARRQQGFSLLELLVVIAILMVVVGAILQEVELMQKRYHTEESALDLTQESREFLDQMVRDIHQTGYPGRKMYATGVLMSPWQQDSRVAVGLVKVSPTDLWFEADVDGDGYVESVRYTLQAGPENTCPCILQRSQVKKFNATGPMAQITSYSAGLDGVLNSNGTYQVAGSTLMRDGTAQSNQTLYGALTPPSIFTAFDAAGNQVPATDFNTDSALPPDSQLLPTIKSIEINLNVLVRSSGADFDTRLRPALSLRASARISN